MTAATSTLASVHVFCTRHERWDSTPLGRCCLRDRRDAAGGRDPESRHRRRTGDLDPHAAREKNGLERKRSIAVGIGITAYPPHRSVRARLRHTAPTLDEWRRTCRTRSRPGETLARPGVRCVPSCSAFSFAVDFHHLLLAGLPAHLTRFPGQPLSLLGSFVLPIPLSRQQSTPRTAAKSC